MRAEFRAGERVRVRPGDPAGHTRAPRYVRGQVGRIVECQGSWELADEVAAGLAEPRVEPVYTVAFTAGDLWGEGGHQVTVDLWESYIERVREDGT